MNPLGHCLLLDRQSCVPLLLVRPGPGLLRTPRKSLSWGMHKFQERKNTLESLVCETDASYIFIPANDVFAFDEG